jgi:hypothetical protein
MPLGLTVMTLLPIVQNQTLRVEFHSKTLKALVAKRALDVSLRDRLVVVCAELFKLPSGDVSHSCPSPNLTVNS